ncbi:peptidase C14 [Peribacillus deserti]|uniref:Peptidase C14 n=1 Tax=Peribacillus deserti TaxID=673318 RepID=A0A2N5M8Y7_9BACI|nr:caspase family protein [Peribacillus deserti]PLT30824.1 peptidase C14 [Peribacillus deserti]
MVGINDYEGAPLTGCIRDAEKLAFMLKKNEDGSPNFHCRLLLSSQNPVTRSSLCQEVQELLMHEADIALFYFSGHGTVNNLGGYLVTQDAEAYNEGIPMDSILSMANESKVREVIILLDCCHSGAFGQSPPTCNEKALLREGITIITSSRSTQASYEEDGGGIFTSLIYNALDGGAADVLGNINAASLYAYVDQALGPWDQRPLFKSHVSKLSSLRRCNPDIPIETLRSLPHYFTEPADVFQLDPSFEKHFGHNHLENEKTFHSFQLLRNARLLATIDSPHLFYAARDSKSCKLTALGRYYWKLAKEELI